MAEQAPEPMAQGMAQGMAEQRVTRLSTGVVGLDEILLGGLLPGRTYLVRGGPGTGKTMLGLHFLAAGLTKDELGLYINMAEPEAQIRSNAFALGFDVSGVDFLDLSPNSEYFSRSESYDIFSPAEVEREPTTQKIIAEIERAKPRRIFVDAMTQFHYLMPDDFQFRRQILSLLRYLTEQGATVIFSSESSEQYPDADLQFIADGVIDLHSSGDERSVMVVKFRGSGFRSGRHSLRLTATGMHVFPRLLPEAYGTEFVHQTISSGIPELDEMLGGGIERGAVTLITGPNGVGKTTVGLQFMKEAAGRGERSTVYLFEEARETLLLRSKGINIPVDYMSERGTLSLVTVEPLHYMPDEFARLVRRDVEEYGTRIVMIDSISGYRLSMRGQDLVAQLHALCKYLKNMGVAVILINELEAVTGEFKATELGISYLADNIIILRYLELNGELHKAIGVLKKRLSDFEKTLREMEITRYGLKIGKPLTGLRAILSGMPIGEVPGGSSSSSGGR
ncbi:MAG: ATPase domain-containing protein [Caldilineaceae bacterium]